MQIAMMDAYRSEAIKAKEEFDWLFNPRKEWVFSRFTKLLLRLFSKEVSADSVPTRKKLNKNRTNKRIVKESASISRSSSQRCFHTKNTGWKCEEIQKRSINTKVKLKIQDSIEINFALKPNCLFVLFSRN